MQSRLWKVHEGGAKKNGMYTVVHIMQHRVNVLLLSILQISDNSPYEESEPFFM